MRQTKLGRLTPIENTNQKFNEAKTYIRVWVEDVDGSNERPIFLTPRELEIITKRTEKNREDFGKRGWLIDLLD